MKSLRLQKTFGQIIQIYYPSTLNIVPSVKAIFRKIVRINCWTIHLAQIYTESIVLRLKRSCSNRIVEWLGGFDGFGGCFSKRRDEVLRLSLQKILNFKSSVHKVYLTQQLVIESLNFIFSSFTTFIILRVL